MSYYTQKSKERKKNFLFCSYAYLLLIFIYCEFLQNFHNSSSKILITM